MAETMLSCPTLSELRNADYSYFGQLACYAEKISHQAQTVLQDLAEDVKSPGAVDWEGEAGDAAITQAQADLITARSVMWPWDDVAVSARHWQDELEAGTRTALDAVDDAERDGFTVSQDYSVSDTRRSATDAEFEQRVAAAEVYSSFIRHHVGTLVGNESRIDGELKAMTAEWGTLTFPESGGGVKAQPVDRIWKQGPDKPGSPRGPSADDIRRVLDKLPQGSDPRIREVRSRQDLDNLWKWMRQNGVDRPGGYGTVPGEMKDLPDGTIIGRREAAGSTKQPALDVRVPGDGGYIKVHINPRGGVPEIPPSVRAAPAEPPLAGEPAPANGSVRAPIEAAPPAGAPPVKLEPLPPPVIIGGGGEIGGGGGGGIPELGEGGTLRPTE